MKNVTTCRIKGCDWLDKGGGGTSEVRVLITSCSLSEGSLESRLARAYCRTLQILHSAFVMKWGAVS